MAQGSPLAAADGQFFTAIADFNGDGDQDLANVGFDDSSVHVALGGPGSSFTAGPNTGGLTGGGDGIVAGDFNDDGKSDVAVSSFGDKVYVLEGNGDGSFKAPVALTAPGASAVAVGNLDGDDDPDLAVISVTLSLADPNQSKSELLIFHGASGMSFGSPWHAAVFEPSLGADVVTGDFDGDGLDDVATTTNSTLNIVKNGSTVGNDHWTVNGSFDLGTLPGGLAVGDFNGDGDPDLVADNSVLTGGAGTTFTQQRPAFSTAGQRNGVAVGDFNSDGDDDLAVSTSSSGTGRLEVFLGATGSTFTPAAGSPYVSSTTSAEVGVSIGDFDGDGNEDVVESNNDNDNVSVFDGGGTPWSAGNLLQFGGMEGVTGKLNTTPAPPSPWGGGSIGFLRYGSKFGPSLVDAQRWEGGSNFIFGSFIPNGSSLSQTVDVSSQATEIDAKQATASLSARLGGFRAKPDAMKVTATFLDASGTNLGSFSIGPVTATNRSNHTTMLRRATNQAVPAQTRSIVVRLDASQPADNDFRNYASADNVRLFVASPSIPDPTQPTGPGGPDTTGDTTPPETTIDKGPKHRTEKTKAKIRYEADEPSTFQCALKGGKRKLRAFTDCGEAKVKYKHLKPGKKKFQVRAIDAAGNVDATPAKLRWKVLR